MSSSPKLYLWKRNGIYYLGHTDERGKKRWKSTKCRVKSDALKALTDFRHFLSSKPAGLSLSRFSSEFLAYAGTVHSASTVDIYQRALRHLRAFSGDCALSTLSPKDIDKYKSKRLTEVSPVSVNVELRGLRAALNVALRWRLIEKNPFEGVQMVSVPEQQPLYLSRGDFDKLSNVIREQWFRNMVVLAVLTGMRRGELRDLKWLDVDFQTRLIRIQSGGTFKTKHGRRRVIPLNDVAIRLLESLHRKSLTEYIFTVGEKQVSEDWITHAFKKYVRMVGLHPKIHFHSLRHTFASWLVQDGASLYEVQKLLGHSDISVTAVYSHLQPEKLHSTVNRIILPLN